MATIAGADDADGARNRGAPAGSYADRGVLRTETINMVLARAYLLPGKNRVMRCLSHYLGDLLAALKTVAGEGPPEAEAARPD